MSDWTTEYDSGGVDQNVYAIYRSQSTGRVWNGAAMVTWDDADIATYDVAATFAGGDLYTHAIPALPADDTYVGRARVRAGATPATTDSQLGDPFRFAWDGSDVTAPSDQAGSNLTTTTTVVSSTVDLSALADYSWAEIAVAAKQAMVKAAVGGQNLSINGRSIGRISIKDATDLYNLATSMIANESDDGGGMALVQFGNPY